MNHPGVAGRLGVGVAFALLLATSVHGQSLGPEFVDDYVVTDLGSAPGVPASYGALMFSPTDPNILLLAGHANSLNAKLYAVPVTRGVDGSVIGFGCGTVAEAVYDVPGASGGIDGGVDMGPVGVADGVIFYVTYNDNRLGQILPGSTGPDRLINLSSLGVASSTGTLRFVPPGFPGAGRLKIASYNSSRWYDAEITPARDGTFDVAIDPDFITIGGGPEGIVYIAAGNPGFAADSVLVSRYSAGNVFAYDIDSNGDPIVSTARTFITGLSGAEGAAIDPITGDFFFSTFGGGNRVIRVSGFLGSACVGDLNGDGVIDAADLGLLLAAWGTTGESPADLNGSCIVDAADLGILLANWGPCER